MTRMCTIDKLVSLKRSAHEFAWKLILDSNEKYKNKAKKENQSTERVNHRKR